VAADDRPVCVDDQELRMQQRARRVDMNLHARIEQEVDGGRVDHRRVVWIGCPVPVDEHAYAHSPIVRRRQGVEQASGRVIAARHRNVEHRHIDLRLGSGDGCPDMVVIALPGKQDRSRCRRSIRRQRYFRRPRQFMIGVRMQVRGHMHRDALEHAHEPVRRLTDRLLRH